MDALSLNAGTTADLTSSISGESSRGAGLVRCMNSMTFRYFSLPEKAQAQIFKTIAPFFAEKGPEFSG